MAGTWPRIHAGQRHRSRQARERKIGLLRQRYIVRENSEGLMTESKRPSTLQQKRARSPRRCHYASKRAKGGKTHGTHRALRRLLWPPSPDRHPNVLVFHKFARREASWLANDSVKHSFTFTPDAARSLVLLRRAKRLESNMARSLLLPSPTGKQFIGARRQEFGAQPQVPRAHPADAQGGRVVRYDVRELYEMLYQYEFRLHLRFNQNSRRRRFQPTSTRSVREQPKPTNIGGRLHDHQ